MPHDVRSQRMNLFFRIREKYLAPAFVAVALLYVLFHFISVWWKPWWLIMVLSLCGLMTLFFAFSLMRWRGAVLPLGLMVCAVSIGFSQFGLKGFSVLWDGLRQMQALISMILMVPMVGWVLRQAPYVQDVMVFLRNLINTSRRFYAATMLLTQIIAYFLLVGAVPVLYQFVDNFLGGKKGEVWTTYKTTSVLRGFALNTTWVVSFPSFAFAVESLNAPIGAAVTQGLVLSLAGIVLAVFFYSYEEKRKGFHITEGIQEEIAKAIPHPEQKKEMHRHVLEFTTLFLTLLGSILMVNRFVAWGLMIVVPLVILIWTFCYFVVKKMPRKYFSEARHYLQYEMPLKVQEVSIFLSAGVMIAALTATGWGQMLIEQFYQLTEGIQWFNFLWILPFFMIGFAFVGLSPLTTIVLIGGILQSIHLPYPPELVVLSLTIGTATAFLLSPVTVANLLLSSANGKSPWANSFQSNWQYALCFFIMAEAYLQLLLWWKT